jgi:hypothetical protein
MDTIAKYRIPFSSYLSQSVLNHMSLKGGVPCKIDKNLILDSSMQNR